MSFSEDLNTYVSGVLALAHSARKVYCTKIMLLRYN